MKIRSWLTGLAIGVAVIGIGSALVLHVLLDPNNFKSQIIDAVRTATGRELRIAGNMHLSVYPELSLSTGPLVLGNAPGFDGPFATLTNAQLKVRLKPLLASRLEVVALRIVEPVLYLSRNAKGGNNWDDLVAADASTAQAEPSGTTLLRLKKDRRIPVFADLIVDGLHVSDARCVWKDDLKGIVLDISRFALDVSNFSFGKPFAVSTGADVSVGAYSGRVDFAAQSAVDMSALDLRAVRLTGTVRAPRLPQGEETIAFTAGHASTSGILEDGHLQGLGMDVRFSCRQDGSGIAGRADVADCDVRGVAARLGWTLPALSDAEALKRLSGTLAWTMAARKLTISSLDVRIDDSRLTGSLSSTLQDRPQVQCALAVDVLDVDRYLPAPRKAAPGTPDASGGEQAPGFSLTSAQRTAFSRVQCDGSVRLGRLKIHKCTAENVRGDVQIRGSRIGARNVRAEFYQGQVQGRADIDLNAAVPVIGTRMSLDGVQLGPLTRDVLGRERLSGVLKGGVDLTTRGATPEHMVASLSGTSEFRAENGMIQGIDVPAMVRTELGRLRGESAGPATTGQTRYQVLASSWKIQQGVASTSDLLLQAPQFKVTAWGSTSLPATSLNFKSVLYLSGTEGQLDSGVLGLESIPVMVGGTWAKPRITPDMEGVLKRLGGSGGKTVKSILRGVGDGLGFGVRGLQKLLP